MGYANNQFREIEVIRHSSGVAAIITERITDGRVSVMFAREYDHGGQVKRSAFVARRHLAGIRALIDEIEIRLDALEDETRMQRRM